MELAALAIWSHANVPYDLVMVSYFCFMFAFGFCVLVGCCFCGQKGGGAVVLVVVAMAAIIVVLVIAVVVAVVWS